MRSQRIEEIERFILQKKNVSMDEVCQEFGISKSTLRRDLDEIIEGGNVRKIYGGVAAQPRAQLVPYEARSITNAEAKRHIGILAASQVEEGDVIFIDSGTTTLHMAEDLARYASLTVLTNSIEIILKLLPYENITVISLSGVLNRKTVSFTGQSSADVLQGYNICKAFMASTGISSSNGVTNSSESERAIKQIAVGKSQKVYLLVDSQKFDVVSLITYCGLDSVNVLVTDATPPDSITQEIEKHGGQILLA